MEGETIRKITFSKIGILIVLALLIIFTACVSSNPDPDPDPDPQPDEEVEGAYYVSTSGSNDNNGTKDSPWKTIGKAAETLKAGETVYIRKGTYRERVVPKNSGNAGSKRAGGHLSSGANGSKYITYAAYPGETVTIDGSSVTLPAGWGGLFDISNRNYIKVTGLRIINAGPDINSCGILVDDSGNIIIENCYTYNTISSGIGVWGSRNVVIDGNEVELACNDGENECLTVAVTDGFEIKNNEVHNGGPGSFGGEGIDAKDGSRNGKVYGNVVHHIKRLGIYVDAWDKHTYNIEVYQNTVYQCESDGIVAAAEAGGLLENVRIYNNLVYSNKFSGIATADWGVAGAAHPLKDIYIINNTIYDNGKGSWGGGIGIFNLETQNLVIRNNICSQNLLYQILAEVPDTGFITADYNLIHGYRSYPREIYGSNPVTGDPLFISPGTDFHLQAGSPALDSGSASGAPSTDFDGVARPQGTGYDIGAYEKK